MYQRSAQTIACQNQIVHLHISQSIEYGLEGFHVLCLNSIKHLSVHDLNLVHLLYVLIHHHEGLLQHLEIL